MDLLAVMPTQREAEGFILATLHRGPTARWRRACRPAVARGLEGYGPQPAVNAAMEPIMAIAISPPTL
jgi:hypothetical protein